MQSALKSWGLALPHMNLRRGGGTGRHGSSQDHIGGSGSSASHLVCSGGPSRRKRLVCGAQLFLEGMNNKGHFNSVLKLYPFI